MMTYLALVLSFFLNLIPAALVTLIPVLIAVYTTATIFEALCGVLIFLIFFVAYRMVIKND